MTTNGNITWNSSTGQPVVPDRPKIGFIEGDGIGPDIWRASRAVLDAAVNAVYGTERAIDWQEVFAGEKAQQVYGKGAGRKCLPGKTLNQKEHSMPADSPD